MKIVLAVAVVLAAVVASPADEKAPPPKPTAHTKRVVAGWTVHVDNRLLSGADRALGERALRLLGSQLDAIALIVPADKVKRLQRVPIWLDRTHGRLVLMQYHPGVEWLAKNGYSRELVKCVHIPDAANFAAARMQREQPWAMLHELAHAYHDQVLGFGHAAVKAAWERFVEGGRYKSVLHISGKRRPHYALTNPMEFFAEMTEAYFGQNDFFPFNSAELRREEPEVFALLAKLWGPLP